MSRSKFPTPNSIPPSRIICSRSPVQCQHFCGEFPHSLPWWINKTAELEIFSHFKCVLLLRQTSKKNEKIDFSRLCKNIKFVRNLKLASNQYCVWMLSESSEESFMAYGRNQLKYSTIKAIFFDLDNTLVPTRKADVLCTRKVNLSTVTIECIKVGCIINW